MSYWNIYLEEVKKIINKIEAEQGEKIAMAADLMATSIANGGLVHVFGSGHSVIPVLEMFPRYGSFPGFHPLLDPRLMWFNVLGPGGVKELLWLERQSGYARIFLSNFLLLPRDVLLIFSHSGTNAVPVEIAQEAKQRGLKVVSVTSLANYRKVVAQQKRNPHLADISDIVIDNCIPPEDALVSIPGLNRKVAAGSTLAVVTIALALLSEVAYRLASRGFPLKVFISPTVATTPQENDAVFDEYLHKLWQRYGEAIGLKGGGARQ